MDKLSHGTIADKPSKNISRIMMDYSKNTIGRFVNTNINVVN